MAAVHGHHQRRQGGNLYGPDRVQCRRILPVPNPGLTAARGTAVEGLCPRPKISKPAEIEPAPNPRPPTRPSWSIEAIHAAAAPGTAFQARRPSDIVGFFPRTAHSSAGKLPVPSELIAHCRGLASTPRDWARRSLGLPQDSSSIGFVPQGMRVAAPPQPRTKERKCSTSPAQPGI